MYLLDCLFVERSNNMKKCLIIGSITSYAYKEMFPKILNGEIKFGFNNVQNFMTTEGTIKKFGNICWFTNFDIDKENPWLRTNVTFEKDKYERFDNFDAINVKKVLEIPDDYYEPMGVPLLFAEKLNRNQFEILGLSNTTKNNLPSIAKDKTTSFINGKKTYAKLFIRRKK